jgi:twinkle protein
MTEALNVFGTEQKTFSSTRILVDGELKTRHIGLATTTFYGVKLDTVKGEILFPYHDPTGKLTGYKVRKVPDKEFYCEGKVSSFFGQNKVNTKLPLILVEGEMDALSVSEMFGCNRRFAVLSIPTGAGSAGSFIKKHLQYIEAFPKVYVCFDNDDAGQAATDDVMDIIKAGKAYRVALTTFKDANEFLVNNAQGLFTSLIETSKPKAYDGIHSTEETKKWLLDEMNGVSSVYESVGLTGISALDEIFQLRHAELTTLFADPSVGKSSVVRFITKNLSIQKVKCLVVALEETPREWITKVAGMMVGKPIIGCFKEGTITSAQAEYVASQCSEYVKVANVSGSQDVQALNTLIEYGVRSEDVKVVIIDNITSMTADDSNAATRISQTMDCLLRLGKQLGHHTLVVSHTKRREAKAREQAPSMFDAFGSGSIERFSHNVISMGRDVQKQDAKVSLTICKQRATGKLGTVNIFYDTKTGSFNEEGNDDSGKHNDFAELRLENRGKIPQVKPEPIKVETKTENVHSSPNQNDDPRLPVIGETTNEHRSEGIPKTGMDGEDSKTVQLGKAWFNGSHRKTRTNCQPFQRVNVR